MLNVRKSIRGSLLTLGLPLLTFALFHGCLRLYHIFALAYTHAPHYTTQHTPQHSSLHFSRLLPNLNAPPPASGIEPGPPAWESSTLTNEPPNARKNTSMFSTYIVNIRVHCMLHFHLISFIIKI